MKEFSEYAFILALVAVAWAILYVTGYLVEKFVGFFTKE